MNEEEKRHELHNLMERDRHLYMTEVSPHFDESLKLKLSTDLLKSDLHKRISLSPANNL